MHCLLRCWHLNKYYRLQRKVEDWKKTDINKWLAVLQLTKYEEACKSMSGKVRKAKITDRFVVSSAGLIVNACAEAASTLRSRCLQICRQQARC